MAEYTAILEGCAAKYGLDARLVEAVIEQESGGETQAVRLEQGFFRRYVKGLPGLSAGERILRSSSFGLMQIMGQVARELGFNGELEELCKPEVGIEYGCRHLKNKLKQAGGDVRKALLLWNGGGNAAYPGEVLARVKK